MHVALLHPRDLVGRLLAFVLLGDLHQVLVIVLEHWGEQYQWVLLQVLVYPRGNLGEEVVEKKMERGSGWV